MKTPLETRWTVRLLAIGAVLYSALSAGGADTAREPAAKSPTSARTTVPARGAPAGKVLPDPALLDGSNQPAEKKSEFGMIGDFELPGDENAPRNGKVGGGSGGQGGGTEEGKGGPSINVQVPGLPLPGQTGAGAGGGGAGVMNQGDGAGSGAPGAGILNQGQGGGNAPIPAAAAGQQGGAGGQAGGTQVGQLGGEGAPGQGGDGLGDRPQAVKIGDAAMRIPSSTAGVGASAGQVPASANTQNYEKGTGSGGKASGAASGPNRAEKGRAIPAGL